MLGAGSLLLENADFTVTQLTPVKPFAFEPFMMRTHYRFIEGYRGNDTVRGWRDFDSIYHAVFADMRGSDGYPKGKPYSTAPQGLLLARRFLPTRFSARTAPTGPRRTSKSRCANCRIRDVSASLWWRRSTVTGCFWIRGQSNSPRRLIPSSSAIRKPTNSLHSVLLQIPERGGERSGERVVPGKSYAATPKMAWMN